jgi:flagellum-specific peptidoglycan hydrolase FlgJ
MRYISCLLLLVVVFSSCHSARRLARRRNEERSAQQNNHATRKQPGKKYTPEEYIAAYKGIAIAQMNKYGIPASITLAQALLESASGNSDLAINANNHFGVKCTNDWQGETYHHDDETAGACFRSYPDVAASYDDHSRFLQRSRYASLYELSSTDYRAWAHGLKKCGYATNPKYPELLINLIEKYDLHSYDKGGKHHRDE